ncbi:YdaU family protein [Pseudoalteromonas marina]|uniref:YdaU family protein n=1 Tax=Pseudoalteromonas marina TaxID=267375 RepID=UPI003C3159E5
MHYYQFNIGDYVKSTKHLDPIEDLIYRRLLDLAYDTEKPLSENIQKTARLIGLKNNETETQAILDEFFDLTKKGYIQKRVKKEIDHYHSRAITARANGKKGGRPKKTQSVNLANPDKTGLKAKQEPLTINHKPITNNHSKRSNVPYQHILNLYHKILINNPSVVIFSDKRKRMVKKLYEHHENHKNLEWWESYFNRINSSPFLTGKVEGNGRKPFKADFDWILNIDNFVKITEGKYHE